MKFYTSICGQANYKIFGYDTLPTIWCSFDTEDSEYVKLLRAGGYKVIASHIDGGKNFLTGSLKKNMIVSFQATFLIER